MTTLRTTRPPTARSRPWGNLTGPVRVFALGLCVALAGAAGCGSGDRPAAAGPTAEKADRGGQLPPPDTDRIEYDAEKRALTFYDLSDSSRWMVRTQGQAPVPAGPVHRLPEGADPRETFVFYARPGGRYSHPVSVRQIQEAGKPHSSGGRAID